MTSLLLLTLLAQAEAPDAGFETVVRSSVLVDVSRIGGSANVVSEGHLERQEANDVQRVLEAVPGVYVRGEDGYGLRPNIGLRGAASDRSSKVTLMEDGVLFAPAPYTAPAAYFFPLVTRLSGIEVYKGPASIRYGPQTIGGAINLKTRDVPDGSAGMLDLSYGSYRAGKVHGWVGHGAERYGLLLEGVHLGTRGFKELDVTGDTGFEKNELMLKAFVAADAAARHRLEAKLGYADERSSETYLGLTDADFAAQPLRRYAATQRDRMQWRWSRVQLGYEGRLGPLALDAVLYRQDFVRAWNRLNRLRGGPDLYDLLRDPTGQAAVPMAVLRGEENTQDPGEALMVATNDRRFLVHGLQTRAVLQTSLRAGAENRLEVGARIHHDQVERLHTEDAYLMVAETMVPEGGPPLTTLWNLAFTRAFAAYVQDELTVGRLLLAPGVRLEVIRSELSDRVSGERVIGHAVVPLAGAGAVYQLSRSVSALAGVHQGFSPVTPGQPPEVRPERSVNYEAGARLKTRPVRLELFGFFNDYSNLTGECTFSTGCSESLLNRQYNGGAVWVYGLEASGRLQRPGPVGSSLALELAYTWTLSEFRTSFRSEAPQFGQVEAGDELPYVPEHQGSATASVERGGWMLAFSAGFVGMMREVAGSGTVPRFERTDPHVLFDLAVHREVGEAGRVYATAANLFDVRTVAAHRPFGARPNAPRLLQIGYQHRFR